jgi:signal transduction histidine kinase
MNAMWRILRRTIGRYQELVLAATVLAMAGYEAAEMWVLESERPLLLGLVIHALQVVAIVTAAVLLVRAWQRKNAHQDALTDLVERVVVAQEDERRRIAYELHDSISPLVVSAKQHLDTCRDLLPRDRARAEAQLATGIERLGLAIVETRRVLGALRPAALASESFDQAARRCLAEAAGEAGWETSFTARLGDGPLPPAVETAAYRILQEALTNARKHAHTSRLEVSLDRVDGWLLLDVRDYGLGLARGRDAERRGPAVSGPTGAASSGLGLVSMKERARIVGGTCDVERAGERGTRVKVRLPIQRGA